MENTIFKCLGCGNGLESAKAVDGLVTCEFCGMKRTVPKLNTKPAALTYLMLAEHDLEVCEFDNAYTGYRKAAEADETEPEAYFGMALARFKVQYLKDLTSQPVRLQPICHEITEKKFSQDKNYLKALSLSAGKQRAKYEEQAKEIDYINREFCKLKEQGMKYDCFLCVKVTAEGGGHTEDSHTALTLYHELKKAGYAPFYSEEEVRGRAGADYEALILYALWSSKCMLVVCSNEEYLQTAWVKNEYTRFIRMLQEDEKEDRSVAIVFGDTPVEKLAGVQGKIQGIPFKSYDALDRIRAFVDRFTPKDAPELTRKDYGTVTYKKKNVLKKGIEKRQLMVTGGGEITVSDKAKLNIAREFLSRKDFSAAMRFCDQLIRDNPQNGEAYWIRFLAEYGSCSEEEIIRRKGVITDFGSLEKAIAATQDQRQRKNFYKLLSERVKTHHDFNCYREYIELPDSEDKVIAELTEIVYSDALKEKNCEKFAAALKTVTDSDRYVRMNLAFAHAVGEKKAFEFYKNILSVDEGHEEALWFVFAGETAARYGTVDFCMNADNFPVLEEKHFAYGYNGFAADKLFTICTNGAESGTERRMALFDFLLGMIPKEKNEVFVGYVETYIETLFKLKKANYANKYNELLLQIDPYNHGAHFNRCLIKRGLSNPLGLLADSENLLEDENYFSAINCFAEKFPERKNIYLDTKYALGEMKKLLNYPECFEFAVDHCYVKKEELSVYYERMAACYAGILKTLRMEGRRIYFEALNRFGCKDKDALFRLRQDVSADPAWAKVLNYAEAAEDSELETVAKRIIESQRSIAAQNVADDKAKEEREYEKKMCDIALANAIAREEKIETVKKSLYIAFVIAAFVMSVCTFGLTIASVAGTSPLYEIGIVLFDGSDNALGTVGIILILLPFILGIIWTACDIIRRKRKMPNIFLSVMSIVSLIVYIAGGAKWSLANAENSNCYVGDSFVLKLEEVYGGYSVDEYCGSAENIVIPQTYGGKPIVAIGEAAFRGCSSLTSITIPNGVMSIESSAFASCSSLTSITIPNSVTSISSGAFGDCTSLISIIFYGTRDEWGKIIKEYSGWGAGNWNRNTGDYIIRCTDGDIAK